jgi:hypothetical protein
MAFSRVNRTLLKSRRGLEILRLGGSIITLLKCNSPRECSDVAHGQIVASRNGISAPQPGGQASIKSGPAFNRICACEGSGKCRKLSRHFGFDPLYHASAGAALARGLENALALASAVRIAASFFASILARPIGDEILQRSAQPVDRPRGNNIDLAAHDLFQKPIELWPFVAAFGAADAFIGEFVDDDPSLSTTNCLSESLALVVDGLSIFR